MATKPRANARRGRPTEYGGKRARVTISMSTADARVFATLHKRLNLTPSEFFAIMLATEIRISHGGAVVIA